MSVSVGTEIVTEIERYLVMPGQALGAKFDIREFHDEVLKNGAMPLAVLENVVNAYISRKKNNA
jgi:uncharacterized protein (DUF885 family)